MPERARGVPPGPRSPPGPEAVSRARDERRQRARREALDVREKADRPYRSFEVRNPMHGTHYRVLAPGPEPLLLCPCPDFGRRDVGTCKHVEAVRAFLAESGSPPAPRRPGPDPEPLWRAVETAERELGPLPLRDLRPVWAIGRRLLIGPQGD